MSRLAKKSIALPANVKVTVTSDKFAVEGPKGKIEKEYNGYYVQIVSEDNAVRVNRTNETRFHRAYQGLYWSLLRNAVEGVTNGYSKTLKIEGIGYKWAVANNKLTLNVGFSHPVEYVPPKGITLESPAPALLKVSGFDKELVGQISANIRFIKPPEPYKGKGIRYEGEVVRLKEGKTGK